MENQATYELIEKYLNGELSGEALANFEKRLTDEPDLAAELEEIRALHQLVELGGDQIAQRQINQAADLYDSQRRVVYRRRSVVLGMVAILAMVLLVFYPRLKKLENINDQLFAENFRPFRGPSHVRSDDSAEYWEEIRQAYETENYSEVITQLKNKRPSSQDYLQQFYLGMSYLAKTPSQPDHAILAFEKVIKTDNDYIEIAEWYLGLAYLKNQQRDKAKVHFQQLIEKGNTYQREAILDLLARIK
ncbi:MAG: tetratricopeptide repeat protein [Bacteroidia bacterium]